MPYDYDNIVHRWFEELKTPFINYMRANFSISYDDVMDLYTESWLDIRKIIMENRATGDNWRALLFLIGKRKALRAYERLPKIESMGGNTPDEKFDRKQLEYENGAQEMDDELDPHSVYNDPELKAVLGAELSYIPDPCNKILKFYYYDNQSMTEIAEMMNYKSSRSAITTKNRCMDKLKERVRNAVRRLGIMD